MKLGWNSQPVVASCTLAFLQMAGTSPSKNVVNDARWITSGMSANVVCHDSMGLALGGQLGSRPLDTCPNEEADPLPGIMLLVEPGRKLLLRVPLRPVIDNDGEERQRLLPQEELK